MDDRLARRHTHAVAGEREATSHAEDNVGVLKKPLDCAGIGVTAAAEGERVVLGEGTFPLDRGGHRHVPGFRERAQLVPRLGPMDSLTGVNHRAFRGRQHLRNFGHRCGVGAEFRGERAFVVGAIGNGLGPQVVRHLYEDRAGRPLRSSEKTRRSTSGVAAAVVSGSAQRVTWRMFSVELKLG